MNILLKRLSGQMRNNTSQKNKHYKNLTPSKPEKFLPSKLCSLKKKTEKSFLQGTANKVWQTLQHTNQQRRIQ